MTAPLEPAVLIRELRALGPDLRRLAGPLAEQVRGLLTPAERAAITRVYLTGSGDSYHAACAAELAFTTRARVDCRAVSTLPFLAYETPTDALVVAISASGGTQRVLEAVERANEHGALTVAITARAGSPVTAIADRAIVVALPDKERSPGIRTYQASLFGLFMLADQNAAAELARLADTVEETVDGLDEPCRRIAAEIADAPSMITVGSGPSLGTARFAAAKLVEAAGILALAQDIEEWCHVERFAHPADIPVFVIAPSGRARWRAPAMAAQAAAGGCRVIAVTHPDQADVARHARAVLPVNATVPEELSPLLYHLFAGSVAAYLAERLGRTPFRGGIPAARFVQGRPGTVSD